MNAAWKERVVDMAEAVLLIPATRSRPSVAAKELDTTAIICPDERPGESQPSEQEDRSSKRQRIGELPCQHDAAKSYWLDSPKVYQQFKPRGFVPGYDASNCNENPLEAAQRSIQLLNSANSCEDAWRSIISGWDPNNFCSKTEIFEVRQRALFLCSA
jgi:hypothetical protein